MDKKAKMNMLAREGYEKSGFNGTWLYAENGEIISKGAYGFCDAENQRPMREDSIFEVLSLFNLSVKPKVIQITIIVVNIPHDDDKCNKETSFVLVDKS